MDKSILTEAAETISGPRLETYGDPVESHKRIAKSWSDWLGVPIKASDVAMMMVLFKIAREQNKHHHDNLVDMAGYTELYNQCLQAEE